MDSIEKRIDIFFEQMTVGNLGFSNTSSPEGPVAGYSKPLNIGRKKKRKDKLNGRTD